jgi:hypothetical protein
MKGEFFKRRADAMKQDGATPLGDSEPRAGTQQASFEQRAVCGKVEDLAEILANVPDAPPAPGDEHE